MGTSRKAQFLRPFWSILKIQSTEKSSLLTTGINLSIRRCSGATPEY